jgi:two-component system, OmpR family, alkaline phosphatase synthesis response regulator PhoP
MIVTKIVLVEDDEVLAKAAFEEFREAGFSIKLAKDGETGIELIKREAPDLILLDLVMPKKDGFQVLKELKEYPETKNISVIVLTMLDENAEIDKAISLGADGYIVKSQHAVSKIVEEVKNFLHNKYNK